MRIVRVWASIRGKCITNDGRLAAKSADARAKPAVAVTLLAIVYQREGSDCCRVPHQGAGRLPQRMEGAAFISRDWPLPRGAWAKTKGWHWHVPRVHSACRGS